MAISIKNHEDRLVALETRDVRCVLEQITPLENHAKVTINCGVDWTTYDFVIVGWNIWSPNEDEGKPQNRALQFETIPVAYLNAGLYYSHYEIYNESPLSTEDIKISKLTNTQFSVYSEYGRGRITFMFLVKN